MNVRHITFVLLCFKFAKTPPLRSFHGAGGDCVPSAQLNDGTGVYREAVKLAGKIKHAWKKNLIFYLRPNNEELRKCPPLSFAMGVHM